MSTRYRQSEVLLERALRSIPLGTQTYSKSKTQYPYGVSPYFIQRGQGSHVWDVDGNEYIDFVNGLAAITLGYNDPDVTQAVRQQLESGTVFSLPHVLEIEVAELITSMVPCAEMVRFGKNGSDATAGAVRLARAFAKRDHVAVCGYHGWQDWYIGSTSRSLGVPKSTQALTHRFAYNDLVGLAALFKEYRDQIAGVVLEPMNVSDPNPGYLESVRDLVHENGALLIFDETITGFRFANGGAQEYFGVTPDLATFGKGISNGYPLSVLAGRRQFMRLLEEVFFSFTFGGELLSLAAANATLTKLLQRPVLQTIADQGRKILKGVNDLLIAHGIGHILSISGHPAWSFLNFKDGGGYPAEHIKTLFLQEMFAHGILTLGTHNMSWAHTDQDIRRLLTVYAQVFATLKEAMTKQDLPERLHCKPLEPLFKVR
jgi:glutamate-1-semialdehyde 2,1-aminomutase